MKTSYSRVKADHFDVGLDHFGEQELPVFPVNKTQLWHRIK